MAYGHRQICVDRGGRYVFGLGFGRCPVADIRFGLADNSGMFGRRPDFSQG